MRDSERRRDPRIDFAIPVQFRPAGGLAEPWRKGQAGDISAGGLRFLAGEVLERGDRLEFQIVLPIRREPFLLSGEVVWIHPVPEAPTEYGVEFIFVTPDKLVEIDQLVRFLVHRPKGT